MKINPVTNTKIFVNEQVTPKKGVNNSTFEVKDKVEISKAAKEKLQAENQSKIERIKANIANKVYDSDEVIEKVAAKILEEFQKD